MTLPKTKKLEAYGHLVSGITEVLETARRASARSVNAIMTAAYWMIGRRIVEFEQKGELRAEYGEELIERLAADLSARYGRGFSVRNVWHMKSFYLAWPTPQTTSAELEGREILQTVSAEFSLLNIAECFPLPWSAYVRLLSLKNEHARTFYETEALARRGLSPVDTCLIDEARSRSKIKKVDGVAGERAE